MLFNDPTDNNQEEVAVRLGYDQLVIEKAMVFYNLHSPLKGTTTAELNQNSNNFQAFQNISVGCYLSPIARKEGINFWHYWPKIFLFKYSFLNFPLGSC